MARRIIKHQRRYDDMWSVKGVQVVHPPKPTLSKVEHIGEGVLDWLDIAEQARCLDDGLVIDCEAASEWDLTLPPAAPHRSESTDYDVRTKYVRIAARIDRDAKAKWDEAKAERRIVPTTQRAAYGSLRQVRTRR